MTHRHVAIIGAGFSGTVLAVQLLESLEGPATVSLIDSSASFGPGLAYSTGHPLHLMNTPASVTGAFDGAAGHFLAWLQAEDPARAEPDRYVPRALYGRYLADLLDRAEHRSDIALARVPETAIEVRPQDGGYCVSFASARSLQADIVVIATGYGVRGGERPGRVIQDPWAGNWWERVSPDDDIIFRGSGLTMVDQVLRLTSAGHRGAMIAISRRGLLPRSHFHSAAERPVPLELDDLSLRRLARLVNRDFRDAFRRGQDWRNIVDALRTRSQEIWLGWDAAERARFRRHLRPYWDVARHRMAPQIAADIGMVLASGRLTVAAGRLDGIAEESGSVRATYRPRGSRTAQTLTAEWLVDCAGVEQGVAAGPLAWSLRSMDLAGGADGRLAYRLDMAGRFLDRDNRPVPGLYGVGPVARETLWEVTAIPEIRALCAKVAGDIRRTFTTIGVGGPPPAAENGMWRAAGGLSG